MYTETEDEMINVRITRDELVRRGACESGLAYFDSVADDGVLEFEWSKENQIRFAVEAREWIGWAREKNILPIANIRGANLEGANLRGANLVGANLRGAIGLPEKSA